MGNKKISELGTATPSTGGDVPVVQSSSTRKLAVTAVGAALAEAANATAQRALLGLGNVNNTSDAGKPVSTAQQTALDLKADTSALGSHTSDTANPHSVTKTQVGLGNVDNTSDANKPVSTATQTALDLKASASALTTHTSDTANPHSVTKTQVGLSAVSNDAQLKIASNLSDLNSASTARTNLGLGTAAVEAATAFATAAQGAKADTSLQPGGALGTPSSGTLTNATGLPPAGVVAPVVVPVAVPVIVPVVVPVVPVAVPPVVVPVVPPVVPKFLNKTNN